MLLGAAAMLRGCCCYGKIEAVIINQTFGALLITQKKASEAVLKNSSFCVIVDWFFLEGKLWDVSLNVKEVWGETRMFRKIVLLLIYLWWVSTISLWHIITSKPKVNAEVITCVVVRCKREPLEIKSTAFSVKVYWLQTCRNTQHTINDE